MTEPKDKGAANGGEQDTGKTYLVIGSFSSQFAGLGVTQGSFLKNVTDEDATRMIAGRLLQVMEAGPNDIVIDYAEYNNQVKQRLDAKTEAEKGSSVAQDRLKAKAKAAADKAYKAVIEGDK